MSKRQLPAEIRAYLGPCQELESEVEEILEQCSLAKSCGELTDFDPLIAIMSLVADEVINLGYQLASLPGKQLWIKALTFIQDGDEGLDHNEFLPCRFCNQAFKPVIDDKAFSMFVAWRESCSYQDLIAIHRCPACDGQLQAVQGTVYSGDFHTPEPGTVSSDREWAQLLLQHTQR